VTGVEAYFPGMQAAVTSADEDKQAILRDRHPLELTAKRLANEVRLPIAWDAQRALLGIS
jgi:hypothetical protein